MKPTPQELNCKALLPHYKSRKKWVAHGVDLIVFSTNHLLLIFEDEMVCYAIVHFSVQSITQQECCV